MLCEPFRYLVNLSIHTAVFPDLLKIAEVSPIYKKGDVMDWKQFRPVSILPNLSKVFEKAIVHQLMMLCNESFSPHLSGFRKHYNYQDVLLNFVDTCKVALEKGQVYGAALTDLSKAFDCLPYRLTVSKLHAYGVGDKACMLIASYFSNRKQCVKMGDVRSTWSTLRKGAPQGSV